MNALLEQFAGKLDLIYIDPPFATGDDFSTSVAIGDDKVSLTKEASAIDLTKGKGLFWILKRIIIQQDERISDLELKLAEALGEVEED